MLTKCFVCNTTFELNEPLKILSIVPKVCKKECFLSLLKMIGYGNLDLIIRKASELGFIVRVNKEKTPYKSKIEKEISSFFESLGIKYEYEKYFFYGKIFKTYSYQPIENRVYIPDFYLPDYGLFVEAKDKEFKNNKSLAFSKYFPIIVIDTQILRRISNER